MAELVKKWEDHSGDTFTVVYNPIGGEAIFSSDPNRGGMRDSLVVVKGTEESIGISVIQGPEGSTRKSQAGLVMGHRDGVDVKCRIYLDAQGTPCSIMIGRIWHSS